MFVFLKRDKILSTVEEPLIVLYTAEYVEDDVVRTTQFLVWLRIDSAEGSLLEDDTG